MNLRPIHQPGRPSSLREVAPVAPRSRFGIGTRSASRPISATSHSALRTPHFRRAFCLIECLVYISAIAILFTFTGALAWRAHDANRDLRRASEDIVRAMKAGERWREDIRAAIAPPAVVHWDGLPILRVPQGGREVNFAFYNNAVWRKPAADEPWQLFLPRVAASRMDSELRHRVTALHWELELATKQTNTRVKPLFTFLAAPQTTAKP